MIAGGQGREIACVRRSHAIVCVCVFVRVGVGGSAQVGLGAGQDHWGRQPYKVNGWLPSPAPQSILAHKEPDWKKAICITSRFLGGGEGRCPLRSGFQEESVRKSLDRRELFDFADCHTVIPLERKTGAQSDCADFFFFFFLLALGHALRAVNKNLKKSAGPSYGTSTKSVLKPPRPCAAVGGFSPY